MDRSPKSDPSTPAALCQERLHTANQQIPSNGRPNQYFDIGHRGRKTGWQPQQQININQDGLEDFEQYFDDPQPQRNPQPQMSQQIVYAEHQVAKTPISRNNFTSRPLVGRTPPVYTGRQLDEFYEQIPNYHEEVVSYQPIYRVHEEQVEYREEYPGIEERIIQRNGINYISSPRITDTVIEYPGNNTRMPNSTRMTPRRATVFNEIPIQSTPRYMSTRRVPMSEPRRYSNISSNQQRNQISHPRSTIPNRTLVHRSVSESINSNEHYLDSDKTVEDSRRINAYNETPSHTSMAKVLRSTQKSTKKSSGTKISGTKNQPLYTPVQKSKLSIAVVAEDTDVNNDPQSSDASVELSEEDDEHLEPMRKRLGMAPRSTQKSTKNLEPAKIAEDKKSAKKGKVEIARDSGNLQDKNVNKSNYDNHQDTNVNKSDYDNHDTAENVGLSISEIETPSIVKSKAVKAVKTLKGVTKSTKESNSVNSSDKTSSKGTVNTKPAKKSGDLAVGKSKLNIAADDSLKTSAIEDESIDEDLGKSQPAALHLQRSELRRESVKLNTLRPNIPKKLNGDLSDDEAEIVGLTVEEGLDQTKESQDLFVYDDNNGYDGPAIDSFEDTRLDDEDTGNIYQLDVPVDTSPDDIFAKVIIKKNSSSRKGSKTSKIVQLEHDKSASKATKPTKGMNAAKVIGTKDEVEQKAPSQKRKLAVTNTNIQRNIKVKQDADIKFFDPSEENDGTRKSKRTKVHPVAYWRNERVVYNRRESGINPVTTSIADVIRTGGSDEETAPSKIRSKPKVKKEKFEVLPDLEVINYETKKHEFQKLIFNHEMIDRSKIGSNGYFFERVFSEADFFASGMLALPKGAKKPNKNSHTSALVFFVVTGHVEVQINKSSFSLGAGGQFFVPRG